MISTDNAIEEIIICSFDCIELERIIKNNKNSIDGLLAKKEKLESFPPSVFRDEQLIEIENEIFLSDIGRVETDLKEKRKNLDIAYEFVRAAWGSKFQLPHEIVLDLTPQYMPYEEKKKLICKKLKEFHLTYFMGGVLQEAIEKCDYYVLEEREYNNISHIIDFYEFNSNVSEEELEILSNIISDGIDRIMYKKQIFNEELREEEAKWQEYKRIEERNAPVKIELERRRIQSEADQYESNVKKFLRDDVGRYQEYPKIGDDPIDKNWISAWGDTHD